MWNRNVLVQISSLLPRNLTGQHRQPLKLSGWLVLGNKPKSSEREAVVLILTVDALLYLSSVGRKMEGWLLLASIRNVVTAGGWRQREGTEERRQLPRQQVAGGST